MELEMKTKGVGSRSNLRKVVARQVSLGIFVLLCGRFWLESAIAQTKVEPGFNVFSVEQDVEIGRQSAAEAERQLPLLRDRATEGYINEIGQRLAAVAPGAKYPYRFKAVNVSDVNAFALPGGFMYINRGLIETARNEGELAGVMAHEMAHVALRHGTNQASKAYLAQAGLGVLGGVLGGGAAGQIIGAVGGFGLNAVFLKFSRNAETQADIVGAQMMAGAGYNPLDMASMFETLEERAGREPSKVEQFFSSHPSPSNRSKRIHEEARLLPQRGRAAPVGDFRRLQASLAALPPASSMQALASGQGPGSRRPTGDERVGQVSIDRPSSRFRNYEQRNGLFRIQYPENWKPYESDNAIGVTLLPERGAVQTNQGPQIVYGVIVGHYVPFEGSITDPRQRENRNSRDRLEAATQDFVNQMGQTNAHLRVSQPVRREKMDGQDTLSVVLSGNSPVTGQQEQVTLFTRELADRHIVYCLLIAPARSYEELKPTFQKMIGSLRVEEDAEHRAQR
jgi:beta-barrel assembly-enhancing protease